MIDGKEYLVQQAMFERNMKKAMELRKMTREEAIEKAKLSNLKHDGEIAERFVLRLEKLGLLKFDEDISAAKEAVSYCMKTCYTTGNFIKQLEQMGWRIIKI